MSVTVKLPFETSISTCRRLQARHLWEIVLTFGPLVPLNLAIFSLDGGTA